jgi:hypothetical protein
LGEVTLGQRRTGRLDPVDRLLQQLGQQACRHRLDRHQQDRLDRAVQLLVDHPS